MIFELINATAGGIAALVELDERSGRSLTVDDDALIADIERWLVGEKLLYPRVARRLAKLEKIAPAEVAELRRLVAERTPGIDLDADAAWAAIMNKIPIAKARS